MEMQESPAEDAGVRDIHRIVSPMRATLEDVRFEGRNTYGNVQGQQRMYVVVTLHPLQAKESPAEDATYPRHTPYRVIHRFSIAIAFSALDKISDCCPPHWQP